MPNPKQSKVNRERRAVAPYNFVPLPENALAAPSTEGDAGHLDEHGLPYADRYHESLLSGQINCSIVTRSPLYTRRAISTDFYNKWIGGKKMEKLHEDPAAMKEYAQFFNHGKAEEPAIPGSSIRGMARTLVEIVSHGHMRWVGQEPTFTFRAVAAQRDDPLRKPYSDVLGPYGRNVRAGILERDSGQWVVRICPTPNEEGIQGRHNSYLKVKEKFIPNGTITGFRRFEDKEYKPNWFVVCFSTKKVGRSDVVDEIADYNKAQHKHLGILVCTGNMLETAKPGQKTSRRNHAIVLAPSRNAPLFQIEQQAIDDYLAGMSDFVKDLSSTDNGARKTSIWGSDDGMGCLADGAPIFFVEPKAGEKIRYFGHTPNFRIPARLLGEDRAANPLDFVPDHLQDDNTPDLAEAIFGWVEDKPNQLKGQKAGRVFFNDATFVKAENDLWQEKEPIWLRTLSTPKPTTFQHYLVQDKQNGHDPNELSRLAHYGSNPERSQIRGYKQYWSKGSTPSIKASPNELDHKSQLTQVRPVNPGVHFKTSIRFENLSRIELGALLWVLSLPGDPSGDYCHRLGMGKPLGMGGVKISPSLVLDERHGRYQNLFETDGQSWAVPHQDSDAQNYMDVFEKHILEQLQSAYPSLHSVPRIRTLLALLQWREDTEKWRKTTRYMEIEHGLQKVNEYKNRPVLPTAEKVAEQYDGEGYRPEWTAGVVPPARPKDADGSTQATRAEETDTAETESQIRAKEAQPITDDKAGSQSGEEQTLSPNIEYKNGTILSFGLGRNRSFGFIQYRDDDSLAQIFVHRSGLMDPETPLAFGDSVQFTIGNGPNGQQAQNVTRI